MNSETKQSKTTPRRLSCKSSNISTSVNKKGTATMVEVKKLILDLGDAIHYGFKVNTYVNENIINVVNKQLAREGKSLITYGKWALFIDGQIKKERNSN